MFYTYGQNNSGGIFEYDYDTGVSHYVIVEADDAMEADYRATRIGLYFDGVAKHRDCGCCGDRWNAKDVYWGDDEASDEPEVYGEPASEEKASGWRKFMTYEGFIHYKDGRKVGFAHKDGPGLEIMEEAA